MEDVGVVVSLMGEDAVVRVERTEKCRGCRICTMVPGESAVNLLAKNRVGAKVGDTVRVSAQKPLQFKASLLCYLLPLSCALVGLAAGFFFSELAMILLFFGGLFSGYAALHFVDKFYRRRSEYAPFVAEIINTGEGAAVENAPSREE